MAEPFMAEIRIFGLTYSPRAGLNAQGKYSVFHNLQRYLVCWELISVLMDEQHLESLIYKAEHQCMRDQG